VEKTERKRQLGRPRCKWVANIDMDLGELRWGGVDWIILAQDTEQQRVLMHVVMKLWVP
jgi:hypothetical protein